MLYAHLVYRILRVASRTREISESLVVFGVVSVIFFHAAINVGMVVGIFPVVGIPLPLFSYGGSSVLSTLFEMGLVVGIGMRRFTYTGKGG